MTQKDDYEYGDPLPLNEAAQVEQQRHAQEIDKLINLLTLARIAVAKTEKFIDDEQTRWRNGMCAAMPELAQYPVFLICNDGKSYRPPLARRPVQPEWARQLEAALHNEMAKGA